MICAVCDIMYHPQQTKVVLGCIGTLDISIVYSQCPNCNYFNIIYYETIHIEDGINDLIYTSQHIYPIPSQTKVPSSDVPPEYYADIKEAYAVLQFSPKASAALARRCLQSIIRNEFGINLGSLGKEIEKVREDKLLPAPVLDCLDDLRKLGNYASHPEFNTHTGEIIDVTQEEAEWTLDVIEMIASMYFAFKNKSEKIKTDIKNKRAPKPE